MLAVALATCAMGSGACARARPAPPSPDPAGLADLSNAQCLGPADAKEFAVYLHGFDSASPSYQELENRRALARAAEELGIRIALARAQRTCDPPNLRCWGWGADPSESEEAARIIAEAARTCSFGASARFGLIGFSSGGYLATTMLRRCELPKLLPRVGWVVSVGAFRFNGPLEPRPESLAGCGRLVMLIGTEDESNSDPTDRYATLLRAKGAEVRTARFAGGHAVLAQPLVDAVRSLDRAP